MKSGLAEHHNSYTHITSRDYEHDVYKRHFCFMINQENGKVQNCTSLSDVSLVPPCVSISSLSAIYENIFHPTPDIYLRMYIDSIYYEIGSKHIYDTYMSSLDYLITHHGVNTNMNSFDKSILNGVVAELAAESLLSYVHDYLKRNFIAILFTSNTYAINFQSHFLTEAKKVGLNAIAFGYNVGNNHSLSVALEKIKQSNFRTIIVAPQESPFAAIDHLIEKAVKNELVGSDFLWICHHYNRLSIELMKDVQPILMENKGGQDTIVSTFMQGLGLFVPSINKYYIERGYDSSESSYSSIVDFCQSDNENAHVFNDICGTTDNWNIPVDALSSAFAYDSMKASLNRLMDSLRLQLKLYFGTFLNMNLLA